MITSPISQTSCGVSPPPLLVPTLVSQSYFRPLSLSPVSLQEPLTYLLPTSFPLPIGFTLNLDIPLSSTKPIMLPISNHSMASQNFQDKCKTPEPMEILSFLANVIFNYIPSSILSFHLLFQVPYIHCALPELCLEESFLLFFNFTNSGLPPWHPRVWGYAPSVLPDCTFTYQSKTDISHSI